VRSNLQRVAPEAGKAITASSPSGSRMFLHCVRVSVELLRMAKDCAVILYLLLVAARLESEKLAAGDYIEVSIYHNEGAAQDTETDPNATMLSVVEVAP
jgi:hypothetical protein